MLSSIGHVAVSVGMRLLLYGGGGREMMNPSNYEHGGGLGTPPYASLLEASM